MEKFTQHPPEPKYEEKNIQHILPIKKLGTRCYDLI